MRPIPWNKAFRKKDGTLVNMEDIGGGGGSSLPPYSSADAGKVLGVTEQGTLAWGEVKGGGFVKANSPANLAIVTSIAKEVTT